jgi:hypothetical protein
MTISGTNNEQYQARNAEESPILRLAVRLEANGKPYLDAQQFAAGELLRRDFEWAMLAPKVTTNYERAGDGGGRHWQTSDNALLRMSDRAQSARQRVFAAFDAVGPELSGIVYHVCCLAGGLENAERHLALPRRSGKAVLALALTRLARHYGIKKSVQQRRNGQMGHWAVEDYRPTITRTEPPVPHPPLSASPLMQGHSNVGA